jgi:peptidoglycan/xylan/chitin deacetylase (PgdA/CDA1 family)
MPDYWFTDVEGTTTATFQYPIPGYNGTNGVQTTETSADPNGDAKWIWNPVADGDYQFTEYYMSSAVNVVIVEFNMSDGTRQFTNLVTLQPAAAWTEVNKEFNVRPGTVSVTVFDVLRQVGTLDVSDVSLSKLPDGTFSQGVVSLSFDDDDLTFYTGALQPLLSHNFVASENIVDDWIGQPTYMTASQITEINGDGMAIGSHSLSHPYLTTLSDADAQNEIANSKSIFLSMGFTPISVFVYPYGDYNDRIENIVKASGYIGGRGTDLGFNTKNTDPFELRTENVEADTTLADVETWIDQAKQNKTWLILGFHDVSDTPIDEYTITPATFQAILDYLNQTKVQVATTEYVLSNLMK